jgi:hypothetical protein
MTVSNSIERGTITDGGAAEVVIPVCRGVAVGFQARLSTTRFHGERRLLILFIVPAEDQ